MQNVIGNIHPQFVEPPQGIMYVKRFLLTSQEFALSHNYVTNVNMNKSFVMVTDI